MLQHVWPSSTLAQEQAYVQIQRGHEQVQRARELEAREAESAVQRGMATVEQFFRGFEIEENKLYWSKNCTVPVRIWIWIRIGTRTIYPNSRKLYTIAIFYYFAATCFTWPAPEERESTHLARLCATCLHKQTTSYNRVAYAMTS